VLVKSLRPWADNSDMRVLIATAGVMLALGLAAPSALAQPQGTASSTAVVGAPTGDGLPEWHVRTLTGRPPGMSTDAAQAIAAAKATGTMQALHRRQHPLVVVPLIWEFRRWMVDFYYQGRLVAEAEISGDGHVRGVYTGPTAQAVYARGHFLPLFDSWWVVGTFSLLFLLPFVAVARVWRLALLDALAVLSLLISYGLFNSVHLETAVWLVYPPLLYLAARMAWIGFGRARVRAGTRRGPIVPSWVLAVGLLALVAARITLAVVSHDVSDVGVASVVGAHRILDGLPLYYAGAQHADTYGPIAYLSYVPIDLLFSTKTTAAGQAAAIAFDLVTIAGLIALGGRLRPGPRGRRLGMLLAWGWAACPFTLLALLMHTNDGLIAMLSVLALVMFASPATRGAMLGLAAAAKFSPAILLPLFAGPRERGRKSILLCVGSFAAVVVTAIGLALPSGGIREFYDHTIGYQLGRTDVFSPWALHPGLKPVATVIEAGVILLAGALAFVPRRRTLAQVSALAAMLTIAVQLPAIHWFYYYIVWFVPFMLVALLVPPRTAEEGDRVPADPVAAEELPEKILVPA
jgi:hypothetical protein